MIRSLDTNIFERYLILLDEYDQWECNFGNLKPAFHKIFPEFRIEIDELRNGWEPQGEYYLHPEMGFAFIKLLYAGTTIYETGIMSVDGGSLYIPYPKRKCLTLDFYYDYYDLAKLEGKLLKMITSGSLRYDSNIYQTHLNLFLIFDNEEERRSFDIFAMKNYNNIDTALLRNNPRVSLALSSARQKGHRENDVLHVAVASELYDLWRSTG